MKPGNVLILPGWQNSGPNHWQSRWALAHGYTRVEQHDWLRPLRGDWISRLEDVLLSCDEAAVLVAHSLACIQVVAWAAYSKNTHRVKAALLVAPPDVARVELGQQLPGWASVPLHKLPFKSVLLHSQNDPFCSPIVSRELASAWGSDVIDAGSHGHLNAESGLQDWPHAHAELLRLMA